MTRSWRLLLMVALVGAMGFLLAACTSPVGVDPPGNDAAGDESTGDDTAGDDAAGDDAAAGQDTTAPAEVNGLGAVAGDAEVTLSWAEPGDGDFAEVRISWAPVDGEAQPVTVAAGTTSRSITGLTNGTLYTFTVVSVDDSGNPSAGESVNASPLSPTDTVSININFNNPEEPTIAFTGLSSGNVEENQVVTVEATSGFSTYEWLIDGTGSAALSVSGATDNTAEIDTGELGLGTRTLTLIVDAMYSAQTSFTVVQP